MAGPGLGRARVVVGAVTHPVQAAISGLLAVWRDAPSLEYETEVDGVAVTLPLQVDDGRPLEDLDNPRALFVGTGSDFMPGGGQGTSGYDLAGRNDVVDVACEVHVWSGDTDPAPVRADALAVFDELTSLLHADPHLGGSVDWARVSRSSYIGLRDDQGVHAVIEFTVRVDASRDHEG